jgi:hypothetical protein
MLLPAAHRQQIAAPEFIEAPHADAQRRSRFVGVKRSRAELLHQVADVGGGMALPQLRIVFKPRILPPSAGSRRFPVRRRRGGGAAKYGRVRRGFGRNCE